MSCQDCGKPEGVCVCDRVAELPTRVRVVILQHPQEQDVVLGTTPLLLTSLPNSERVVGLSWRSLEHALGHEADPARWAVVYPGKLKRALSPEEQRAPALVLDKREQPISPKKIDGVVVLDGTWSQTKTLWWRNAWLLKLARIVLHPKEPSIYGRARKEPRREYISTLEATADALVALGEPEATRDQLRRLFRTMVQRARDFDEREKP
jgi:DTW domain-containing protein YfiP